MKMQKRKRLIMKDFYGHFFHKGRLYKIQKLRDTLSILAKKIKRQIRDRTSKNLEKIEDDTSWDFDVSLINYTECSTSTCLLSTPSFCLYSFFIVHAIYY